MAVTFNVTVSDAAAARMWEYAKSVMRPDGTFATDAMTQAQRKAYIEELIKQNESRVVRGWEQTRPDPDFA